MKECLMCKEEKPLAMFYKDKTCRDGHVRKCIVCYEMLRKKKKLADPITHLRKTQSFWLKRRYGITLEKYEQMLEEQNYKCAICGRPDSGKKANHAFCVDHCHKSGTIRGLLCMPCNRSLGQFQDSAELLRKAANYIDHYKKDQNEKELTN